MEVGSEGVGATSSLSQRTMVTTFMARCKVAMHSRCGIEWQSTLPSWSAPTSII